MFIYFISHHILSYFRMNNQVIFVTNKICPFAERVWITLEEKKVPYTLREVSLTNKEKFFTQTYKQAFGHDPNAEGKVPILIDNDKVITESDLISWYLAEKHQTGSCLIPNQPYDRLRLRWFVGNFAKLIGVFYGFKGYKYKTEQDKQKHLNNLNNALKQLESALTLPYALGENFTLADILLYPWFARWCVIENHVGVKIDENNTKIHQWVKNVQSRDSVKATLQPDQFYITGYSGYFN